MTPAASAGRPSPFWVIGRLAAFIAAAFIALAVLEWLTSLAPRLASPRSVVWAEVVYIWSLLLAVVAATYAMLRRVDHSPWSAVGLGREALSPGRLARGALLGGLTIGVASVFLLAIQELRIIPGTRGGWLEGATASAQVLLPAAFMEELTIRGYAFSVIRRRWGWKWATISTSIVFGILHIQNPGADPESIGIVIVAGFFLAAIFLVTRSLYAAGIAHFAWNWTMAGLLHTPVSGAAVPSPGYRIVDNGPDWITGGAWGPEGGFAAAVAMFAVIFYLYARHLRRMES